MKPSNILFLFGAGVPLLVAIVAVADRKGCFKGDEFVTPGRRRAALGLLVFVLTATVLLPAATASPEIDTSKLRFHQVFSGQGLLVLFLVGWWILSGRPPLKDFLSLRSARPWTEAGAGVCLGLIGWSLTLLLTMLLAFGLALFGASGPQGVPPLVKWIAALPAGQRLIIVATAMTVEEFQFRAFLQKRFGAVAASILFLLAHGGYGEPFFFVGLIGITVVLAAAFRKTGSTWAPMLAHGTFDAIQLFIFLPLALRLLAEK